MAIECPEKKTKKSDATPGVRSVDYVKKWKNTRKELLQRAADLRKRAERNQRINPAVAAELMKRSKALQEEADRMKQDARNGLPTEKVRRAAALGRIKLLVDGEKHK